MFPCFGEFVRARVRCWQWGQWDVDNIPKFLRVLSIYRPGVWSTEFNSGNMWNRPEKKFRILGNVVAKCHHQLGVGCMISHVHSTIMWRNILEKVTCTQENRGKAVSFRLATTLFGKWLKKPFLTQMLKRLIDLMRTGLFCERNFYRQLVYMEGMELYAFFWPWSTTIWTVEL